MEAVIIFMVGSITGFSSVSWFSKLRQKQTLLHQERESLQQINGIGPIFSTRLQLAGIRNYEQLAAASPEYLTQIASDGRTNLRMDVCAWIEQAQALTRVSLVVG
ncbi:MAG: hypothetical protein ACPG8W_00345 [Candidatus Promineifilaceae bacterium]